MVMNNYTYIVFNNKYQLTENMNHLNILFHVKSVHVTFVDYKF